MVHRATGPECGLVTSIFWIASPWIGFWGNTAALGSHCRHNGGLLSGQPCCDVPAHSLSRMGQFRHCIKLYPLETESMIRTRSLLGPGLCCQFPGEPVKFRTTTVTAMLRLSSQRRSEKLSTLCFGNANALMDSLKSCAENGIGAFRIKSQILPVKTHPQAGYDMKELPDRKDIISRFQECGDFVRVNKLRLSFHPDQFVVLNSPTLKTLESRTQLPGRSS